jgi:hypothetical protein
MIDDYELKNVPLPGALAKLARTREPHGVVSHFGERLGQIDWNFG